MPKLHSYYFFSASVICSLQKTSHGFKKQSLRTSDILQCETGFWKLSSDLRRFSLIQRTVRNLKCVHMHISIQVREGGTFLFQNHWNDLAQICTSKFAPALVEQSNFQINLPVHVQFRMPWKWALKRKALLNPDDGVIMFLPNDRNQTNAHQSSWNSGGSATVW